VVVSEVTLDLFGVLVAKLSVGLLASLADGRGDAALQTCLFGLGGAQNK
jgi:hypothetical protein